MKQLSAIAGLSLLSFGANAQLQRGTWMLGTNLGSTGIMRADGYSSTRIINASLTPQAGLFVSDRLVLGAGVGLNYSHWRDVQYSPSKASSASISVAPFARYYFAKRNADVTGRVVPFVEAGLGATMFKNRWEVGVPSVDYVSPWGVGFNAHVAAGVNYFITPNIAAEAKLQYSYANGPDISGSKTLSGELGFKVFLRGKGASRTSSAPDIRP
jgi:opacity protein-like surface antigen